MNNQKHRVVITGVGLMTPLGHNVPDTWEAILAGKSGLGDWTLLEKGEHQLQVLCEVKDFDANAAIGRKRARRRDRVGTSIAGTIAGVLHVAIAHRGRTAIHARRHKAVGRAILGGAVAGLREVTAIA